MSRLVRTALTAAAVCLAASTGQTAERDERLLELPVDLVELDSVLSRADRNLLLAMAPESVVDQLWYWRSMSRPLRVCFFRDDDGANDREIRRRIMAAALGWELPGSAVRFDFGSEPDLRTCDGSSRNEVRISFRFAGVSSLIGREAEDKPQSVHTMNFYDWDIFPPDDAKLKRVVLHEFGHALGLHHEHQNPYSVCESQFKWPVVRARVTGPEFGWREDEIVRNLKVIYPPHVIASEFDPESIMIYSLPADFFEDGEGSDCYVPENSTLSRIDRETVLRIYPPSDGAIRLQRTNGLEQLKNAVTDARASMATKASLLRQLNVVTRDLRTELR